MGAILDGIYNVFFKKESVPAGRGSELEMSKYWYLFNHHGWLHAGVWECSLYYFQSVWNSSSINWTPPPKKAISPLTPIPQPRIKQNENLLVPNRLFLDLLLTEILTSPRPSGGLRYWEVRSRSGRVPTDPQGGAVLFIKGPSVCLNGYSFPPGVGGRAR